MSDDDPFLDPPRPIRRLGPTWMEATRHVPMDIDRYLEPDPPLPDLLQEARGLGIAADTFKHPPYLDLDLTWGAGSPYYDQITEQLIHEDREFRAELQSLVLDIQDSDKKRMTQMLYDEENPGEPDWKTILPPIRSSDVQPEPHRLTYQGELVAKRILTTKLAGPDFAASLPPEDSPFEIENLKITPAMQKIADDYRKAQAFEKLECGKESLAFLADLPNQKLDGVYDDVLPKPKANSINSDATLGPGEQSSTETANDTALSQPKRKHVKSRDPSPLWEGELTVQKGPSNRSVSATLVQPGTPGDKSLTMGAPVKKPRKASSLSQMLPTGKRMDLDHPVPDFAGDKLASKAGGTSSVSGSRTTSKISPGRFPNTASRTAGSSRKPATGQPPSNAPTALKPDNARDNESKRSALNESNSRRKSSGNGSTKTGLGTWLGSLSRFMDTRSMSQNERLLVGLPADPETPRSTQSGQSPSSYMERLETIKADNSPSGSSFTWGSQPNSPARSALATNLVLFLSTKLLRTHLPLVMYMEGLSAPPKLMFRDYDAIVYPPRAGAAVPDQPSTGISDPESQLPEEADIIISPNAGIMLTTTHDLTQRYLPGHPPLDPRFPDRTRFHGPVLTRMMKLSVRYEYLYILAYHSTPLSEASRSKMDPATKEGITSLQIFSSYMSSLSAHSHLIPLFVTPHPEKVAKTIFAMARRHMSAFQSINLSRAPAWDRAKDNEITSQVHRLITEHETRWEWFLRGLGFNPFAARLILAILEAREQNTAADGTARSALHVFLDMDPKRILYEFRRFVGRDVINRVCGAVGVAT